MEQDKLIFWNARAVETDHPGSDDFVLKAIEQSFILQHMHDNIRVLDIGCGDGSTLSKINNLHKIDGVGVDFSEKMIEKAVKNDKELQFLNCSIFSLPENIGHFDVIYTQRCLINLNSFDEQSKAIDCIYHLLKPNAIFIMVESTFDGLDKTNELRNKVGLDKISPPWHNTFFTMSDVSGLQKKDFRIKAIHHISSTYSFLSRVIYAKIAEQRNEKLRYDSEINLLSTQLPQEIGEFGPVKGWVWEKGSGLQ